MIEDWLVDKLRKSPVTEAEISQVIRLTTDDFLSKLGVAAQDIGNGHCCDFAEAVFLRLGAYWEYIHEKSVCGLSKGQSDYYWADSFEADLDAWRAAGEPVPDDLPEIELMDALGRGHEWIILNGRHYDATSPEGVDHAIELHFFADEIKRIRQENAPSVGLGR